MQHDYNLEELLKISVRGMNFNIMPRYQYHYTDKEYEKFSLDLLSVLVEKNGTAIDIGAHYGIYSLLAAKLSKKVYAFEPVPENFEILKKNVQDNKFDDIIVPINKAVSDSKGELEFNVTWASDSAGFYEHPNAEIIKKIIVQVNSIDQELSKIKDLSFIKIDTEGHEIHVLDGLRSTLKNNKSAKMLIEFNPECLINAGSSTRKLIEKILDMNYDIFAVHEETRNMVRVDLTVPDEDILQGRTYLNLLCLPKGTWDNMVFLCHNAGIGGAELNLLETVQGLLEIKEKLIIPFVVFPGEGPIIEKFRELPIPIQVIPMRGWTGNRNLENELTNNTKIINGNAVVSLSKIFSDFKPRVSVTNTLSVPWCGYVSRAYNVPHLWSIHEFGDLDHELDFDYGYDNSLKYIDQFSDLVLANSNAVKEHISPWIVHNQIKVLPPNISRINNSNKHEAVSFKFSKDTTLKLVMSGRIMDSKGQFDAVRALHELRKQNYKAELMIIGSEGSEQYTNDINEYCTKYKLTKYVHMLGFKTNPLDYINLGNVFLMCSRNEAFGRVTVEAMLIGKAVVGAKSGGTVEIIDDGVTGLLYEPNNIDDLVNKILLYTDTSFRHTIELNAKKDSQKKFPNNKSEKLYSLLNKLTKKQENTEYLVQKIILEGLHASDSRVKNDITNLVEKQSIEIGKFSDEYNKVYKAYNQIEEQLNQLRKSKVIKTYQKIDKLKNKLKKGKA